MGYPCEEDQSVCMKKMKTLQMWLEGLPNPPCSCFGPHRAAAQGALILSAWSCGMSIAVVQHCNISVFHDFRISRFQSLNNSWFQGSATLTFQVFKSSRFQDFQDFKIWICSKVWFQVQDFKIQEPKSDYRPGRKTELDPNLEPKLEPNLEPKLEPKQTQKHTDTQAKSHPQAPIM